MAADKGNVLDFTKRLKQKRAEAKRDATQDAHSNVGVKQMPAELGEVLDMTERRREMVQTERRNVRRTVLGQFIGAFIMHPAKGLESVSIFDISENGLSFDISVEGGRFKDGETVHMRIYLSHELYFPFAVKVTNTRSADGAFRHGAVFESDQPSASTLKHFARFLEGVSTLARRDQGEKMVGKID